jgi:hypothetical protein
MRAACFTFRSNVHANHLERNLEREKMATTRSSVFMQRACRICHVILLQTCYASIHHWRDIVFDLHHSDTQIPPPTPNTHTHTHTHTHTRTFTLRTERTVLLLYNVESQQGINTFCVISRPEPYC